MAAVAVSAMLATSCVNEEDMPFKEVENRSLKAWMDKNRPDLAGNYQEDGRYYVEVLEAGIADSVSINSVLSDDKQGQCWVFFNVTGRDLHGQVCLTRSETVARMQGTFTKYTHYVPYMRFIGENNVSLMEGTYLAMKNVLTLGEDYAAEHGLPRSLEMRCGTKLRLYLPSSIVNGAGGLSGDGGYEGDFVLDGNRPMIMDIEITDRVNNPLAHEGDMVDAFGEANGGVSPVKDKEDGEDEDKTSALASVRRSLTRADEETGEEEVDDGMYWRHAYDTIRGLLVSKKYVPNAEGGFDFAFRYPKGGDAEHPVYAMNKVYTDSGVYAGGAAELDRKINAALIERFGEGVTDGEKVGDKGTARVWYICRFLDGFVIDTNIDEVKELVYGKIDSAGSVLSYSVTSNKDDYITAWYYVIPELKYGQWATFVTTSSFAYGATGMTGSSSTSSSGSSFSYYPYYNFYNYYNSYYGNSYYDMYYNNYYNSMLYDQSTSTTTKTTITTEIQPYIPLIFQVFVEKKS